MKQINKKSIVFTGAILLFGSMLFLPIKIPYTIKGYGKIVPVKKWLLTKGADGELVSNTINYLTGTCENYSVTQINRGENVQFFMNTPIINKGVVTTRDTIAFIKSSQIEEQLVELTGELEIAKALKKSNTSGEKEALIQQALNELDFAATESAKQEKVFSRFEKLTNKNLVSQEEYDNAKNKANLARIKVDIASAKLKAVQSGVKQEDVKLYQAKINMLQNQLDVLRNRINLFTIICPINGKITKSYSSDTLLIVTEKTSCLAILPIKLEDGFNIYENQIVKIKLTGSGKSINGKVTSISDEIKVLNNHQTVMATVLVLETVEELQMGMFVKCTINCEPIILSKRINKFLKI
jgi:hypothetical protein